MMPCTTGSLGSSRRWDSVGKIDTPLPFSPGIGELAAGRETPRTRGEKISEKIARIKERPRDTGADRGHGHGGDAQMATKEQRYIDELTELGVYVPAFRDEVHQLCILERELSRAMKEWKATAEDGCAPSVLDPCYDTISKLRRDILAHRDALGLTPKGLQRLRRAQMSDEAAAPAASGNAAFSSLLDRVREATHGQT